MSVPHSGAFARQHQALTPRAPTPDNDSGASLLSNRMRRVLKCKLEFLELGGLIIRDFKDMVVRFVGGIAWK